MLGEKTRNISGQEENCQEEQGEETPFSGHQDEFITMSTGQEQEGRFHSCVLITELILFQDWSPTAR